VAAARGVRWTGPGGWVIAAVYARPRAVYVLDRAWSLTGVLITFAAVVGVIHLEPSPAARSLIADAG